MKIKMITITQTELQKIVNKVKIMMKMLKDTTLITEKIKPSKIKKQKKDLATTSNKIKNLVISLL